MGSDSRQMWRLAGKYSAIGIEMAAAVAIGTGIGWWADKSLEIWPYLTIAGFFIGLGAAGKAIVRAVEHFKNES